MVKRKNKMSGVKQRASFLLFKLLCHVHIVQYVMDSWESSSMLQKSGTLPST